MAKGLALSDQSTQAHLVHADARDLEAEKPILIHWKGKGSGVTGEQWFIFKILADGDTELRTLQEYSGVPLLLLGPRGKSAIEQGVRHVLDHIKKEAEANARTANWVPRT